MPRKRRHEEHENHERWLVSYADFITLLFAFFTSMYAISSVNEGKFRILSEALVIAFNSSIYTSAKQEEGTKIVKIKRPSLTDEFRKRFTGDYQRLMTALQDQIKNKKLSLLLDERGIIVRINEGVLFEPGSDRLVEEGYGVLDEVALALKDLPNQIRIEGHTDNIPIKTERFPSNWDLSSARALRILKYFIKFFDYDPRRLSAVGYGEFRPIASNDTPSGRARNRRVDILILKGSD